MIDEAGPFFLVEYLLCHQLCQSISMIYIHNHRNASLCQSNKRKQLNHRHQSEEQNSLPVSSGTWIGADLCSGSAAGLVINWLPAQTIELDLTWNRNWLWLWPILDNHLFSDQCVPNFERLEANFVIYIALLEDSVVISVSW